MGWFADQRRHSPVWAILLAAAVPRVWAAVADQGVFWPDEIFQSLEQAHRFAFGYGYVSWEFQEGARSWLFPGALGLLLKLAALVGVRAAPTLVILVKLVMVAVGLVGLWASMRLAAVLAGARAAVLAGVLGAAFPAALVFGSRCMSEMASGPLLVGAALLCLGAGRRRLAAAGALAALAVFFRYQNGVVTAGLLLVVLARRGHRDALWYAAPAVVVGLAGGLLDLFTWGRLFHSFRVYVAFNLLEGRAADFGVDPYGYYAQVFWTSTGLASLVIAAGLVVSWRRARGLLLVVAAYVFLHVIVPHKEYRFLLPVVPLALALAGVGLADLVRWLEARRRGVPAQSERRESARRGRQRRRQPAAPHLVRAPAPDAPPADERLGPAGWSLVVILLAVMAWHAARATFDDLGQHRGPASGARSPWRENDDVNRLLWAAGARPDLCGLALVGHGEIWTGGYAYLHRDVPMLSVRARTAAEEALGPVRAASNYALAPVGVPLPSEYQEVERRGGRILARRAGPCGPPPPGYTRLFPK